MNKNIIDLYEIGKKNERYIIGLMSGTSLDGLDIAYCKITGNGINTEVSILAFETIDYPADVKNKVRHVFAKSVVDFPYLALLNEWIGNLHAEMINTFLKKYNINRSQVDLIASHGQTVMHVPRHQHNYPEFPNATLQIGDGDHIAVGTGIITISDFRQKHLAAGGEGAPLAVYGDYLIFSSHKEDRIMLNMGGIGNFTFLPKSRETTDIFVTDTGPGNTIMDAYMQKYFSRPYDLNSSIALRGQVQQSLLYALKQHYFFALPYPKTTGPEVFNLQFLESTLDKTKMTSTRHEDVMATLNRLSAETITEAIMQVIGSDRYYIYMSGGGAHNPLLVSTMEKLLPNCIFQKSEVLGIKGDAKEAVLFAVLANETIAGNPIHFGQRQGVPGICMGKISLPA